MQKDLCRLRYNTLTADSKCALLSRLLRLTSRKPLWLDLQLVDIKSRWRHNWKLAQVVNSHLLCDPTIRQPGFDLPQQQWSLLTIFARNRDTAVPAEGNGDLQTLICVLVARPRRCPTLSNPVPGQNWMAAYLGYTLRMKTLFRGWPIMVHDTHTRKRRLLRSLFRLSVCLCDTWAMGKQRNFCSICLYHVMGNGSGMVVEKTVWNIRYRFL